MRALLDRLWKRLLRPFTIELDGFDDPQEGRFNQVSPRLHEAPPRSPELPLAARQIELPERLVARRLLLR